MTRAAQIMGLLAATLSIAFAAPSRAADFASPADAATALASAVESGDAGAIERVLGRGSKRLVESGDPVADKADRAAFAASYAAKHDIETQGEEASLLVGKDDFLFPIPLRHGHAGWSFDVRAGSQQILDRRIGRDELNAIEVCRAIVEAERDYAGDDPDGDGIAEYAQKFISTTGKKDGLFWEAQAGAPASPLGPLIAEARAQGYGGRHSPYHGYYYKILKAQGPHAPGGARDYIVKGYMMGGFALVAYPAKWGDSGVMTFLVNQDGIVLQRNLGRDTGHVAAAMTRYDPDEEWRPVEAAANR